MAMGIVLWQNTSIRKYKGKIKNYNNELLEAKEKIRFLKHDLRQEINSRKESQQSLKNVLETLKEANTLKESFLANISHEVRTPLNGIMGFTTLIKEEARQIGNLKIENYSQIVSSSSERLLTFLNNVIDLSRIEAKELNIKSEQCNLVEITNQAIESQIFRANEKALKLIVEMDGFVPVMANHKYLSKVICNILDNAVKYTNHGFVKVGLYIPVGNKEVTLYIEDSGIGINPGFLAHIFEAFRQESTGMTRSFEGGGLALPLSKKLIEMMGGRLEIQSEKAKGTIVKIHLPKSEIPYDQEVVKSIQEKRVTLSKIDEVRFKTIFLIEDDSINGELIEAYLVGYAHVVVAKNGNEALKILDKLNLDQKQIDIFLMDINLPQEWDGIKLMKEIQNRWPVYEDVPFVAQTAYALEGDREKLIEKGFHDYISKPLKKKELIKCINNHLKNQVTLHNLTV
jgi:signal transduction histidine kinase/CheY-like chemotaxis protein